MKTARKHTTLEEEEGGAGTYFVRSKEGVGLGNNRSRIGSRGCKWSRSSVLHALIRWCIAIRCIAIRTWRAFSKMSRTFDSASPNHLLRSCGPLMEMKFEEHSVAMAFAISVLPHPGGP